MQNAVNGCFWCLFHNHVLIVTVAVRILDFENKIYELKRMFVLPDYQGKGYGRQLLKHAIDYSKEQKFDSICLDTRNDLAIAQYMYKKYGFKQIDKYNNNEYADEWLVETETATGFSEFPIMFIKSHYQDNAKFKLFK